jgi:hypothetical protein
MANVAPPEVNANGRPLYPPLGMDSGRPKSSGFMTPRGFRSDQYESELTTSPPAIVPIA